ncbi:MAG: hypothetical protein JXA11_07690 [Phycisphaerae bacterium]|nr:hypothetical protein [Phycisphaerae bacterium]
MRRWMFFLSVMGVLAGCAAPPVETTPPAKIEPPKGHRPELWVVGGMASFQKRPSDVYIAGILRKKIQGVRPDVCVTSFTKEAGPDSILRNIFNTPKWLDADAENQAWWALKMFVDPKKDRGHFVRPGKKTKILVILISPCTQTLPPRPPEGVELDVVLYRDPKDRVPNQEFRAPRSMEYFSKFGDLKIVEARPDLEKGWFGQWKPGGIQGAHHFSGYWYRDLKLLEKDPTGEGKWRPTGHYEDSVDRLDQALHDPEMDYVFIGHSQGANIIMKILHRGFDVSERNDEQAGPNHAK